MIFLKKKSFYLNKRIKQFFLMIPTIFSFFHLWKKDDGIIHFFVTHGEYHYTVNGDQLFFFACLFFYISLFFVNLYKFFFFINVSFVLSRLNFIFSLLKFIRYRCSELDNFFYFHYFQILKI